MGDIFVKLIDMPCDLRGHVNLNYDGSYTIFINARLSHRMQQQVYLHEMHHILNFDFERENVDEIEAIAHMLCE